MALVMKQYRLSRAPCKQEQICSLASATIRLAHDIIFLPRNTGMSSVMHLPHRHARVSMQHCQVTLRSPNAEVADVSELYTGMPITSSM